jgi:D-serine deaminase-like pyridoxal phosphate-dependent protein
MPSRSVPYPSIDTPAVLIDMDKLEGNIKEMFGAAKEAGVKLRPHVKVHQCPDIAKMQIAAGAHGVEVGPLDQAIVMADAGIGDIVIAHPFYGDLKIEKIKNLLTKHPNLKLGIVVDMFEQAKALSDLGQALGKKIGLHIKVDTGIRRYGVLPAAPVLALARQIKELPGVELKGIYAHESGAVPTEEGTDRVALEAGTITCELARLLRDSGFPLEHVAVGASPTHHATCRYIKEGLLKEITELHPGQRFIGDISYMMSRGNTREGCALSMLTTVVSTSHKDYVVIDAGFKALGSDSIIGRRDTPGFFWNNMASFGSVQGRTDLWVGKLGAESGWIFYKDPNTEDRLQLGDRVEIVPNSATLVVNIHDVVYGVRNGQIEREFNILGRGKGS